MAVNKVVYGTTVLVDLTADTVTAATLASGATAHGKDGNAITGTMAVTHVEIVTAEPSAVSGKNGYIFVKLEG